MAGVVMQFGRDVITRRVIRDDVLDSLYGAASARPRALIEESLGLCGAAIEAMGGDGVASLDGPVMGLHPGPYRETECVGVSDAIRQAVLLFSSLAQTDYSDDEEDAPAQPEEVNHRFVTEVREAVLRLAPTLAPYFNKQATLHQGGSLVRFGFLSDRVVMHFSIVSAVRQSASVSYARAKLWELARAKEFAGLQTAALISAVPPQDDLTLGGAQKQKLKANLLEIEREADDGRIRFLPVESLDVAAEKVLELSS